MPDYVTLLGADTVREAGQSIRGSAEQMHRAAQMIDESSDTMRRTMDDFICRLERVADRMGKDIDKLEKLFNEAQPKQS